jgi:hypothetical protein
MAAPVSFYQKAGRALKPVAAGTAVAVGILVSVVTSVATPANVPEFDAAMHIVQSKNLAAMPAHHLATYSGEDGWLAATGKLWALGLEHRIKGTKAWTMAIPVTGTCPIVFNDGDLNDFYQLLPQVSREQVAKLLAYHEASHCQQRAAGIELATTQQKEIYADVRATLLLLKEEPQLSGPILVGVPLFRESLALAGDKDHDTSQALRRLANFLEGKDPTQLADSDMTRIAATLAQGQSLVGFKLTPSAPEQSLDTVRPPPALKDRGR